MKKCAIIIVGLILLAPLRAQEVQLPERASLDQLYGEQVESEGLLPMNDLNVEFGYFLYEKEIVIESANALLEVENVRDYAVVYLDDKVQGEVTNDRKKLLLLVGAGTYTLRLYVENIGRITYGPEILDNSKGLFGKLFIDGREQEGWKITVLKVKETSPDRLTFSTKKIGEQPALYRGTFTIGNPQDLYLDLTGWGMGEAWINGQYIGSYWEQEKQQSILVSASLLTKGRNEVIVFDLKNNNHGRLRLSDKPVFK